MAWSTVVAGAVIQVACLLACQPALAGSAQEVDPGPDQQTSFGPVEPSQQYLGAIEEPSDVDMFNLRLPAGSTSIGVDVTHTNDACEIWAILVDRQGTQTQEVFVPRTGTARLQTIASVQAPYYVQISTGPLRTCAGATYSLELFLEPFPLPALFSANRAVRARAVQLVRDELACFAACSRAADLGKRRWALISRHHRTSGAKHRRVERRLRGVTRRYRKVLRLQGRVCGSS
jgi:hypothetical protein